MTRAPALLVAVLASLPAAADMFQDGSNAKFPEVRAQLGLPACDPVAEHGADPTGVTDAAAAINACAASLTNGQQTNVYLPPGTYRLNGPINLTKGQALQGSGRGTTILAVDQAFSPAATGVIVTTPGGLDPGPEIRDLGITFAQPSTQSSRAAFQNLGTCTSTEGGTGCKYPPAILGTGAPGGRVKVHNVRIAKAWDGISDGGTNTLFWLENVEMSALNVGVKLGGARDFSHITQFHFWNFDIGATSPLYTGVYADGGTYAAQFGGATGPNGVSVNGWSIWRARTTINDTQFWGSFTNVMLDGNGSTLEIANNFFVQIANVYATGYAVGSNTNCQINVSAGRVQMANLRGIGAAAGGDTATSFCLSGAGAVTLTGPQFQSNALDGRSIKQTGGTLMVTGGIFESASGTYTVPLVDQTGGSLHMVGNHFFHSGAGTVTSISVGADSAENYLADNKTLNWPVVLGFSTNLGYYDLGDQLFSLTATPTFDTVGDFAPTGVSLAGGYFRRGSYVDFYFTSDFSTNAYTTAAGSFGFLTNMPVPVGGSQAGCQVGVLANVTIAYHPGCNVGPSGSSNYIIFPKVTSGGANTYFGTTEVPPSKAAVHFRIAGRYRAR